MVNIEQKRNDLINMINGSSSIMPPVMGVKFNDTEEVYYYTPPTPQQLKLPAIVFMYDSRADWEAKAEDGEVLYNIQGRIVIRSKGNGKAEE